MRAVVWHTTMSLDGFIAGPEGAMDWVFAHAGPNPVADEMIETTGAILAGRGTYDVGDRERGGPYGGVWSGPIFVLTHHPPNPVPDWMSGTFLDEDIDAALSRALAAAGGKNLVLFGADVARQAVERGRLDEIVIHLAPVLLGDGVRLFEHPGGLRVDLELTEVSEAGQITNLRFRVPR